MFARARAILQCLFYSLNIGAHKDEYIPSLTRLAKGIKDHGALAAIQLNHAGRYNFPFFLDGKQPVAPSPIASKFNREMPRELTVEDINGIVKSFAAAAARVKTAGFDAIDVLAGTGYLISQFFSPLTNERKDDYGGSFENRMRFGLEVQGNYLLIRNIPWSNKETIARVKTFIREKSTAKSTAQAAAPEKPGTP